MAAQSDQSAINDFAKLLKNIALELTTRDIETILFLLEEDRNETLKERLKPNDGNAGIRLFSYLRSERGISPNNVDLLIEILDQSKLFLLSERVKDYQAKEKSVHCLRIPSNNIAQSSAMSLVHFIICCGKCSLTDDSIKVMKNAIRLALDIKLSDITFKSVEDCLPAGYIDVTYILHANYDKIDKLQCDALNKEDWLINLGVQILQVDGQAKIVMKSNCQKVCNQPCKKPLPAVRSVIGNFSLDQAFHSNDAVDIILAIEVPYSVDVQRCKAVSEQCDKAISAFVSHKRLSLITYGNHARHKLPDFLSAQSQPIVVGGESFEEGRHVSIIDAVKERGRCGDQFAGNSGIADALKCAHGLMGEVRPQATKVCIITCFLGKDSSDLKYYRCYHGNDPIKVSYSLAEHRVSLYIVGIVTDTNNRSLRKENHFLSGITHITGGRYFEIADISLLCSVIEYILKETTSIESIMGTVNDIVIDEINNQYGDINDVHLADHLNDQLQKRSVKVDKIEINQGIGRQSISKLSERVAWANDLSDAIEGVKNMKLNHRETELQTTQSIKLISNDSPDVEMSSRMVMRQLNRSSYNI